MVDKLKKYNSRIKLFVNKFVWHTEFYEQYNTLTENDKYPIYIEYNNSTDILFNAINIDYANTNTNTEKYITIDCEVMPYLQSIKNHWETTINDFTDNLYNSIESGQSELYINLTLNININLSTAQTHNLLHITRNTGPYLPIDKVFLSKYDIDFSSFELVLSIMLIRLRIKNPFFKYSYDYAIHYFLI
jgi:hypothetical protein